jgi:hypothetical protein
MGLDMYLYKQTYVKNWSFSSKEERFDVDVKRGGHATKIKPERVAYIKEEVAYWRKFNALHGYIIENFANQVDNCQEVRLTKEDLTNILDMLIAIRDANYACAEELMPPVAGFFFGGQEVDEFYIKDVEFTIDILQNEIDDIDEDDDVWVGYTYLASW